MQEETAGGALWYLRESLGQRVGSFLSLVVLGVCSDHLAEVLMRSVYLASLSDVSPSSRVPFASPQGEKMILRLDGILDCCPAGITLSARQAPSHANAHSFLSEWLTALVATPKSPNQGKLSPILRTGKGKDRAEPWAKARVGGSSFPTLL